MNLIRQVAKTILTALVSRDKLLVRGPRLAKRQPAIALTFDDGPHPELTPRLLDQLNTLGLKATFFVIGQRAEKYPGLIRRMHDEGHEVANHSYSHSEPGQTPVAELLDEVRRTDEILLAITGRVPPLFRPPKGDVNWRKLRGLWRARKTIVLWNVDPKDFRMKSADEMNRWCEMYSPENGDIVLFHDIHPYAIDAMKTLASQGHFERFETITISDWFSRSTPRKHLSPLANSAG
jgi:peptidoglycan/xylan/chitin deacetylase (PgdA/CDA1 family)